jgi:hypothetical protein
MKIILNILMMYGLAFAIGMFVAFIIWLLYTTMSSDNLKRFTHRETYLEMKRLKQKKY